MTRSRQLAVFVAGFFVVATAAYWLIMGESLPVAVALAATLLLLSASSA